MIKDIVHFQLFVFFPRIQGIKGSMIRVKYELYFQFFVFQFLTYYLLIKVFIRFVDST